jgi:hypothetical protein
MTSKKKLIGNYNSTPFTMSSKKTQAAKNPKNHDFLAFAEFVGWNDLNLETPPKIPLGERHVPATVASEHPVNYKSLGLDGQLYKVRLDRRRRKYWRRVSEA